MNFPSVALIHDGAPTAFTYGHHPNNARVAISRGLIDLLAADELEAVVGHELGHARNWDMALMTLANLVPLLLFYLYDVAIRFGGGKKGNDKTDYTWAVAIGAYAVLGADPDASIRRGRAKARNQRVPVPARRLAGERAGGVRTGQPVAQTVHAVAREAGSGYATTRYPIIQSEG